MAGLQNKRQCPPWRTLPSSLVEAAVPGLQAPGAGGAVGGGVGPPSFLCCGAWPGVYPWPAQSCGGAYAGVPYGAVGPAAGTGVGLRRRRSTNSSTTAAATAAMPTTSQRIHIGNPVLASALTWTVDSLRDSMSNVAVLPSTVAPFASTTLPGKVNRTEASSNSVTLGPHYAAHPGASMAS